MSAHRGAARSSALVGLISDTHGTLDAWALEALAGVDLILHAGDVCAPSVLWELETVARVVAVAGNCDAYHGMGHLPRTARATVAGVTFAVVHEESDLGPVPKDVDVVVCGHTHRPDERRRGGVLYLNPGSASDPRSEPAPSVARVEITPDGLCFRVLTP